MEDDVYDDTVHDANNENIHYVWDDKVHDFDVDDLYYKDIHDVQDGVHIVYEVHYYADIVHDNGFYDVDDNTLDDDVHIVKDADDIHGVLSWWCP